MDTIRLGIISTARINERSIIQVIQHIENVELLAVASRSKTVARDYCRWNNIPKSYGTYEEMLSNSELDAVYISVPNALHGKWIIKALMQGKHVLCEKPLSSNPSEVIKIKELAKKQNLYVAEAMHYRYHPSIQELVAKIQAGIIGDITNINISFVWDLKNQNDIRLDLTLDGGALMDVGCYCLDFIHWLTGNDKPVFLDVSAEYAKSGVDTSIKCKLLYSNKITAEFYCNLHSESFDCSAEISGTLGTILLRYPFLPVVSDSQTTEILFACEIDGWQWKMDVSPKTSYLYQLKNFIDKIQNGFLRIDPADSDFYYNAVILNEIKNKVKNNAVLNQMIHARKKL